MNRSWSFPVVVPYLLNSVLSPYDFYEKKILFSQVKLSTYTLPVSNLHSQPLTPYALSTVTLECSLSSRFQVDI